MVKKTERTIGELLRHHRLKASLKQDDLAQMLGYDNSHISRVERGQRLPTLDYLQQFVQELFLSEAEQAELVHLYQETTAVDLDRRPTYLRVITKEDWGEAPDVHDFYGRETELDALKRWVGQERCRVVAVLGMGGLGKTAFVTKLAEEVRHEFDYVIWRSLRNMPPPADILRDCLQFFSDQSTIDLPEEIGGKIARLLKFLRERRCLLILDNVEAILEAGTTAGQPQPGYEAYSQLIQRAGETRHQSCLLLTSREKPKELAAMEGETAPVRIFQLQGVDQPTGRAILQDKQLSGSDASWATLIYRYSGNPLALKLVSETIRDLFNGGIADFLNEETAIFGGLREMLDQQFERLSILERDIMYWLAIERGAISLEDLQENIGRPVSNRDLLEGLNFLIRRSLIERGAVGFTLQNVVMEYVTDRFIDRFCAEVAGGKLLLFHSHPLIKAQTKDYIREGQIRLILEPVADKLAAALGQKGLEDKLGRLLLELRRTEEMRKPSYAGGNVLDILLHIKSDLTRYDFSHLAIRQAYLRDIDLRDTNFAYANLAKSVFTDTFGSVFSVTFSPDGKLIAAGTTDNQIHLWQVANGEKLLVCRGHTGWVRSVAFSPDGRIIASGGSDRTIRVWDVQTGQCLRTLRGHTDRVRAVAFCPNAPPGLPDNLLVSGGDDHTVRLWDVATGECLRTLAGHHNAVRSVVFNGQGDLIASGGRDYTVRLWEAATGRCLKILKKHGNRIESIAFNPAGTLVASGSSGGVRIWDVATGQCLRTLAEHTEQVKSIAFSPLASQDTGGDILASGSYDHTVKLWEVDAGQCFKTLRGHKNWVRAVAFHPDGRTIVSGGDDKTKKMWDVHTGQCLETLLGYTNQVWSTAFSPDGRLLAGGGEDHIVRLWDVESGQCTSQLKGHRYRATSVAFSPDGLVCASGSDDQTIRLWSVATGECLHILPGHRERVTSITFDLQGKLLASASGDRTVRLWDVDAGQCVRILQGHTNWVQSIAFSPDGTMLASCGGDQVIRLWDLVTGKFLSLLQGHTGWILSVAFSPNGQILATGSRDQTVRLWDIQREACLNILQGHTDRVWAVDFSPDGRILASSSEDHTIRLWDVRPGLVTKTLRGHTNRVRSVAHHPNGTLLASSSDDGTVKLWDAQTGLLLQTLRSDRPYERMNITGVIGLTEAQIAVLKTLGAVEGDER